MSRTYLVELYLPSLGAPALADLARRARAAALAVTLEGTAVRYIRAIYVPGDETCFVLFEAASKEAVRSASRRASIACDRIVEALA